MYEFVSFSSTSGFKEGISHTKPSDKTQPTFAD
jgi:hypothetical protein